MSKKKIIVFAILLVLLVIFGYWFKGQIDIDRCLDSGGRWNYEKGICQYR